MKSLLKGKKKLYLHANHYETIISGLEMMREIGLLGQVVLIGARDAMLALDYLKEYHISVLLDYPYRLQPEDSISVSYQLACKLHEAGILVGLGARGASARSLALLAGRVAAQGLSREAALSMITSHTAQILGIDHRTGTLEVGKDAHLLISEGDLLDARSHQITEAFLQGVPIEL